MSYEVNYSYVKYFISWNWFYLNNPIKTIFFFLQWYLTSVIFDKFLCSCLKINCKKICGKSKLLDNFWWSKKKEKRKHIIDVYENIRSKNIRNIIFTRYNINNISIDGCFINLIFNIVLLTKFNDIYIYINIIRQNFDAIFTKLLLLIANIFSSLTSISRLQRFSNTKKQLSKRFV